MTYGHLIFFLSFFFFLSICWGGIRIIDCTSRCTNPLLGTTTCAHSSVYRVRGAGDATQLTFSALPDMLLFLASELNSVVAPMQVP
ncbi:hypothetical protein V8C42DRAFT_114295 [Trichoderma barbatum]